MPICAPLQQMFLSVGIPPPAVLANASIAATGSSTANVSIDTDTAGGTMYFVVSPAANIDGTLTAAQIVAGQDIAGAATYANNFTPISGSNGSGASLLSPSTAYLVAYVQHTASGYSNVKIAVASATTSASSPITDFQQMKVGAGGFIVGLQISNTDGTMLVKTDSYGGYVSNTDLRPWRQLLTHASMPGIDISDFDAMQGFYEVRFAPSNTSRFYLMYRGKMWRSDDKGLSWTELTGFTPVVAGPNGPYRYEGPYIEIDPINADVVYVGTPTNGVFVSTNAGVTWAAVAAIPATANGRGHKMAFDKYSGATGGRTNLLYITSDGNGFYKSDQRVSSGAFALMVGSPSSIRHLDISPTGVIWAIAGDALSTYRFKAGVWTQPVDHTTGNDFQAVACDPNDANHIVIVGQNSEPRETLDEGATWSLQNFSQVMSSPEIPWLEHIGFVSAGTLVFDPSVSRRIWLSEGTAVWSMDMPAAPIGQLQAITWKSHAIGIEQLIGWVALAPPSTSAKPLMSCQDRGVFRIGDLAAYPSTYGPHATFTAGWSIDWASTDPQTIVGIFNFFDQQSGISRDGGQTWTNFATVNPDGNNGGSIAAVSPTNILYVTSNGGNRPHVTNDGGNTWTDLTAYFLANFGISQTEQSWHSSQYDQRQNVCADRVRSATFYLQNKDIHAGHGGIYRSRDGGLTWVKAHGSVTGSNPSWCTIKAVPGHQDHLFYTDGYQFVTSPASNPFAFSVDGGDSWNTIPGFAEVRAFGFGIGGSYPAICAFGWYNNVPGFWACYDWGTAQTWQQIGGPYAAGNFYDMRSIDGDKNVAGLWYAAAQNGFVYQNAL